MASEDQARLTALIGPVVTSAGFDLEEVTVVAAGRRRLVRVVIDGDHGVALDAAAQVSRSISDQLDEQDSAGDRAPLGSAPYTLEVSSPGIGRPLTLPRHFRRASGRLITVTKADGTVVTARIRQASDTTVELLGGLAGLDRILLPLAEIVRAKVEVEFSPPPAAVLALLTPDTAERLAEDGDADDLELDDEPDDSSSGGNHCVELRRTGDAS